MPEAEAYVQYNNSKYDLVLGLCSCWSSYNLRFIMDMLFGSGEKDDASKSFWSFL